MPDNINQRIVDPKAVQYVKQSKNLNKGTDSDLELQKFAARMLANLYDNCADVLEEYNKNRGIADVGLYLEGARKFIDWASLGNIKSTSHIKDSLREKANELKNININDTESFKKRFKELSGVEYNEENIRSFMELVGKEGVNTESDEFKNACYKAFGLKGTEKQQKYVQRSSFVDGIGDIALMLVTLGAVSKTKMMGKLTTKLYKTLEEGATKFLKSNNPQKPAKLGTSMIMGGATLAGYTLTKESLDNLSNPVRDAKSFSTWKQTGIASLESFGFGAFGGLLNETVVGPLVKYLGKPGKQVSQAVGKALRGNAELSGKEIMQTVVKAQNLNVSGLFKMNAVELKDFAQILGAHAAGFGVEVVGFAGYEAGLDAIKDICDPQTGRLPEDMTLDNLTKYLGHKIGEQFSNLGTIKGVSQLLMMSKGGKTAQRAMMNKMITDSQKLNDVKFKKVNQNGNEVIEMTLPDGSKKLVSSTEQTVQTCQALMQMEFIVNNLQQSEEEAKSKPEDLKTEEEAKPESKNDKQTDGTQEVVENEPVETSEKPELKENQEQVMENEPKVETEISEVAKDEPAPENKPAGETANETVAEPISEEVKDPKKVETNPAEDIKPTENSEEKISESEVKNEQVEPDIASEKSEEIKPDTKPLTNQELLIEKADDTALRAIQEIDMEAFEGRYNLYSDFEAYKADLANQGITTYAIKGEGGNVVGYYQLEPIENGELYIHSIGVRKELRNSRTSYKALKQAQEAITEIAKQENLDKVVLDVDAEKPELVKLYKKFGFVVTGENRGTEAGHQYHDYRMEADVKKVLACNSVNAEPEAVATNVAEEVKPTEEIENKKETSNNSASNVEGKLFFEPLKAKDGLVPVKIGGNDYAVNVYEKNGKQFFSFDGTEFEIHYTNKEELTKVMYADDIYSYCDFGSKKKAVVINGKIGYINTITKNPNLAIQKLDSKYGINIFTTEPEIVSDGIIFNKNGQKIKLQIVEDDDVRLSGQNVEKNVVYVTNKELINTLEKFNDVSEHTMGGEGFVYNIKDIIEDPAKFTEGFLKTQLGIKEYVSELKAKASSAPKNEAHMTIDNTISEKLTDFRASDWDIKELEEFLQQDIDEAYKDYPSLKPMKARQQNACKNILAKHPEFKKYLASFYRNMGYLDDNNVYTVLTPNITAERLLAMTKICQSKGKDGYTQRADDLKQLSNIPDKFLAKSVLIDNITEISDIMNAWNNLTDKKLRNSKITDYADMSPEIATDILKHCIDEYGEFKEHKIEMVKMLLSISPEFAKHYSSYYSNGPFTMAAEIAKICDTPRECVKMLNDVIPLLETNGLTYDAKYSIEEIKALYASDAKDINFKIEVLKYLRENKISGYNYSECLNILSTPEKLNLFKEVFAEEKSCDVVVSMFRNSTDNSLGTFNRETFDFLRSLNVLQTNTSHFRSHYNASYLCACAENNYNKKLDVINKILKIQELTSNKIRESNPLTFEQAKELLSLPQDKYQQVYDVLFLQDPDGFIIRVDGDYGRDCRRILTLMSDDVILKRFYDEYLPIAKKYGRGTQYPYIMQSLLTGMKERYNQEVKRKDWPTILEHLKYMLDNSDFNDNSLVDACFLDEKNYARLITDIVSIKGLGENQPYDFAKIEIAELDDMDYLKFKNIIMPRLPRLFKDKSINSNYSKLYNDYLKLTPAELDRIADTVEFYTSNLEKLDNGDKKAESKEVSNLIHENYDSVLDVVNIIGQEGMNNAIKYNYKGLEQFLKDMKTLYPLDDSTKLIIKERLNSLETVEEKLDKLSVIAGIIRQVSNEELTDIVTSKKLDTISNSVNFFTDNIEKLEHADLDVTVDMVRKIILDNPKSVLSVIDITSETELKHALGMKYRGLKTFLESTKSLSNLEPETRVVLRDRLALLPHPEQKLEKLSVVAALVGKIDNGTLQGIIRDIKSPEMTMEQQELADRIFADSSVSYETQIENFIKEFDVPSARQDSIRKFLLKQNLQSKYVTPPPYEKQLEIIDKKINAVVSNDKIPQDKKDAYLKVLNAQKADLIANPDKYTKRRLNENVMKLLEKQVEAHINLPNNNRAFYKSVNRELYKLYDVEQIEELLKADIRFDSKYFAGLFNKVSDSGFKTQFKKLLDLIKANPNKNLSDILDTIPTNMETRKLFKANGLDYDRWIKYDENFNHRFEFVIDVAKSVQAAKDNLMKEFNSEVAQKLDPQQISALVKIAEDMDIQNVGQKDLPKIIKAIEVYMDGAEYWQNKKDPAIKEFRDHIKIHKKNIHDIESLRDTKEELFVRLWDEDDIGRNLFFGNHVGCCTSIGNSNSFAAPQHLMNSFVNGIEIVDKASNSMGNSMCYFAKVDGNLTFIIDSFEANGKLGAAPEVTDAIIEFGKKVCDRMGQPDANIMFGPNYNKVNFDRCVKTPNHTVEVIGRAPDRTYIDSTGGGSDINVIAKGRSMHEIIDLR